MNDAYRIFGVELSPFSVKVRSYFRYKGLPHEWIVRSAATMDEYQKHAKIPIIPLVVSPGGQGIQDSTPILDGMENQNPEPSVHPSDPVSAFVSVLLEEFGDEWGNKWMFHLRWAREEDQLSAAGRIAATMAPAGNEEARLAVRAQIIERMLSRTWFVGSNEKTGPQIEQGFREAMAQLNTHLEARPYLMGQRPAYGDFGLWGQIYNAWTDPTGAAWLETSCPAVVDWIHRMLWPTSEGPFENWSSLAPTLLPFLNDQVGRTFCPWTLANEAAIESGAEEFTVTLPSGEWTQKPQKYHAKSLAVLRQKYAAVSDTTELDPVLDATGLLAAMQRPPE